MKLQVALLALFVGVTAQAQSPYDEDYTVQATKKKRVVYDERTNTVVETEPAPAADQGRNPIVIMNNQKVQGYQGQGATQGQNQNVFQQPNTIVEAAPLDDSRAERMRKSRQGMEVQTEQKIVEKLEEARMEDERARAERLFGNGFGSGRTDTSSGYHQPAPEPVPVVIAPQATVHAVTPAPSYEEPEDRVSIRDEIKAAMSDMNPDSPQDNYYVSAQVGLAEYPDAVNVKGNVATGVSVGMITNDRIVVEGTFLYSDYEVEDYNSYYPFKELTQYNFNGALKYQLLPGKLRPFAGVVVGYTYRKAADQMYGGFNGPAGSSAEGTSNAFDLGGTAGLDMQLTDSFAIGGEFRYMTNISYRRDDTFSSFYAQNLGTTPIEDLDYYTITLNGKFTF